MKILLAGFDAFGSLSANPSAELVTQLVDVLPDARAIILPTSYERAARLLIEELERVSPRCCVMFGYAKSATALRLERYARNRDGTKSPDNDGQSRSSQIDPAAPEVVPTSVNIDQLYDVLRKRGHRVELSEDAGAYVCNHTYFRVLARLQRSSNRLPILFTHIPGPELTKATVESARALSELVAGRV